MEHWKTRARGFVGFAGADVVALTLGGSGGKMKDGQGLVPILVSLQ